MATFNQWYTYYSLKQDIARKSFGLPSSKLFSDTFGKGSRRYKDIQQPKMSVSDQVDLVSCLAQLKHAREALRGG